MNSTVKNQLLKKVIDEEKHKTYYERKFETTKCNEKWSTDVSKFHAALGKLLWKNEKLDELEIAMKEYTEYYNAQRITTKLKG